MIGMGNQRGLEAAGIHLGSVWELRGQAKNELATGGVR